jgi:hypothetical protein
MFDRYIIGESGFRNVTEAGSVTGFEVQVRIAYYRGIGLSMVEGFDVSVDDVNFPREKNLFTIRGRTLTFDEMETEYDERWEMGEFAALTVPCDGGLAAGAHKVSVVEYLRISYMPVLSVTRDTKTLALEA